MTITVTVTEDYPAQTGSGYTGTATVTLAADIDQPDPVALALGLTATAYTTVETRYRSTDTRFDTTTDWSSWVSQNSPALSLGNFTAWTSDLVHEVQVRLTGDTSGTYTVTFEAKISGVTQDSDTSTFEVIDNPLTSTIASTPIVVEVTPV